MSRLMELTLRLSPAELREVEDFAEFLLTRHHRVSPARDATSGANSISFDRWAGCLSHIDPDKSDKQVLREAWSESIDKHTAR